MDNKKWSYYHSLCDVGLRNRTSWMKKLEDTKLFSAEDLSDIEDYENEIISTNWKRIERKERINANELINELKEEINKDWAKERRMEYLEKEIGRIELLIEEIYNDSIILRKKLVPYWFRNACLELKLKNCNCIKELKKNKMELRVKKYDIKDDNGITPDRIAIARNYSIDRLFEAKRGFIKCLWHDDNKPSMWIKGNFGHCFVCGVTKDVIDLAMESNGISFVNAVKMLS